MEEEISLIELLEIIKKRLGLIINMALLGILLFSVYTFFIVTPQYSSTTDLIVNQSQSSEIGSIERSDIERNLQLINTYSDIIQKPVILDPVVEELNMSQSSGQLGSQVSVSNQDSSQMFSVTVTDENPYDAATIANTIVAVFQERLPEILHVDNVAVLSTAEPSTNPTSPNTTLNLIIGLAFGGMVGIGLAFLLEFMDNTVKNEQFIVEEVGWTNLGPISEMSNDELASDGRSDNAKNHPQQVDTRGTRSRV